MDFDELLSPDFDPNVLTIPQLKSFISSFDIELPSKQEKKAVYVEIYRKKVTANAAKLRAKFGKIKPSAEGIMAVSKRGSPNEKEVLIVL
jgi:hypothetical protein